MQALQIQKQGGLEVLEIHEIDTPKPNPDEVLVRVDCEYSVLSCFGRVRLTLTMTSQQTPESTLSIREELHIVPAKAHAYLSHLA